MSSIFHWYSLSVTAASAYRQGCCGSCSSSLLEEMIISFLSEEAATMEVEGPEGRRRWRQDPDLPPINRENHDFGMLRCGVTMWLR